MISVIPHDSDRKISERCENSFVSYGIHHQELCDLTRQITKEINCIKILHKKAVY